TEAGGNILFAEKIVGAHPAAKFRSQLPGLFHGCFRHQNDEFVSAVTSHHIRTPAIGFENVAHALQHQVAFQVPVEIVDEFEAIEVHQDQSEGAPRASGALPLGGERFHKETVRLDTRKAVGNGLLLCFLKSQRVVQGASDQVRQSAEQQDLFFGEV